MLYNNHTRNKMSLKIKNICKDAVGTTMAAFALLLCLQGNVFAASYSVSGTLNYRVLDGSKNNKYYSIGKGKDITFSGTVSKTGYNSSEVEVNAYGNKVGTQTTYINLYEQTNSGKGVKLCGDSVKVSDGSKSFKATGKSQYANKKYVYIYKPMNDGYDLKISGKISY